jgi:hypothetical protein
VHGTAHLEPLLSRTPQEQTAKPFFYFDGSVVHTACAEYAHHSLLSSPLIVFIELVIPENANQRPNPNIAPGFPL